MQDDHSLPTPPVLPSVPDLTGDARPLGGSTDGHGCEPAEAGRLSNHVARPSRADNGTALTRVARGTAGPSISRRDWVRRALAAFGLGPLLQPEVDLPGRRIFTIAARKFTFDPEVIDVRHNDIVRLTITSADIAHSFTVDAYRIQKRVPPGGSLTFEFRADEVGRFPFYCSLRAEAGCAEMRGELIVR